MDVQATAFFCTLTPIVFFRFDLIVIVIFALPVFLPALMIHVPFGFPETVTIFLLLLTHDLTESPFAISVNVNFCVFCPRFNCSFGALTFKTGFSLSPTIFVSFLPQELQVRS